MGKGDKKSEKSKVSQKKALALVQWVGGEDDRQYHIIEVSWITNFDAVKWRDTTEDERETEIAEWRVGKKNASNNWDCYDCRVLEISGEC